MTVLAYRLTVWVVSMHVESPRHHHRATLLQNRRSPVDARHSAAVVPVRPLSAFFLEWASAMPALMIEYQVDLRRRPNLSEMFQEIWCLWNNRVYLKVLKQRYHLLIL